MTATLPAQSEAGFAALQAERVISDESVAQSLAAEYKQLVSRMREVFDSGRTKDVAWRITQLAGLKRGVQESSEAIKEAIHADLGGFGCRPIYDTAGIVTDSDWALANVREWANPATVSNDMPFEFFSKYEVRPEPKGVTLNIAPWNFPFAMCFQPLVGALAAGNCVVIKPSELAPKSAAVIEMIVSKYLDNDCIRVIQGAVPETTALLEQHWDHIFYTGNGVVGRIIMHACAKHLTPLSLELGGKSPVIIDKTANIACAVNRIYAGKYLNQGQICIAPDYVLIDKSRQEEFVKAFVEQVEASGFGVGSKNNSNWGNIINSRHAERLKRLIETSGGSVLCGGAEDVDLQARHVPLTVINNVSLDAPIMHEEIFGPLLPVVGVDSVDEVLKIVKSKERPLALYVFSTDKKVQERIIFEVPSGGVGINACVEQIKNARAPFGGTGASGFGRYHGKFGFDEFSHYRTVLRMSGSMATLPPPQKHPEWLYGVALKALVTGFIPAQHKFFVKMLTGGALTAGAAALIRSRL